ncbi:hypothetical protein ACEZDB_32250 [Streptacidiphilus sp. N1-3]|uniref:Uncharacterized protein n=1 Tax=Streptacidiphilus alkalitolerans TaxID=3342712 RepID=A0ABV6XBD7_9ACTN
MTTTPRYDRIRLTDGHAPTQTDKGETAATTATRALAAWGITAHADEESMIGGDRNTWLIVGYNQTRNSFPDMHTEPYAVLYLYNDTDEEEELTIDRAPRPGDCWYVHVGDGTGHERLLLTCPADQLDECVDAVAEWITTPASLDPATALTAVVGTNG